MSCTAGHVSNDRITNELLQLPSGRGYLVKQVLTNLGYSKVISAKLRMDREDYTVIGGYREGKRNLVVCVKCPPDGESLEISGDRKRAEQIKGKLERLFNLPITTV